MKDIIGQWINSLTDNKFTWTYQDADNLSKNSIQLYGKLGDMEIAYSDSDISLENQSNSFTIDVELFIQSRDEEVVVNKATSLYGNIKILKNKNILENGMIGLMGINKEIKDLTQLEGAESLFVKMLTVQLSISNQIDITTDKTLKISQTTITEA